MRTVGSTVQHLANCTKYVQWYATAGLASGVEGQHLSGSWSIRIRETHAEKGASDRLLLHLLAGTLRGSGEQQIGPRVRDAAIRCQTEVKYFVPIITGSWPRLTGMGAANYTVAILACGQPAVVRSYSAGEDWLRHPASEPPLSCDTWAVRHTARFTSCTNHAWATVL